MSKTVTVLPTATVIRQGYDGTWKEYAVTAVHLDSNVNMYGDPLHELHAVDSWGQGAWWFETSDSLKATFDEAVSTFISQDDVEANVSVALGNG